MSEFQSSGDLIADRRYGIARALAARGDFAAAADVFAQAAEAAPAFVAAWFALGDMRQRLGDRDGAIAAFVRAQALDPQDRHGARLRLILLGAVALQDMPRGYVRALFDQIAPRFDAMLTEGLAYRGPALLREAILAACSATGRPFRFAAALDLGCGTGLGGAALRGETGRLTGVDLSAAMIDQARAKRLYDRLEVADLGPFLAAEAAAGQTYDLVFAADVFVYLADLAPVGAASARLLAPGGLLAFTVETHADGDVRLGDKLRFAHGAAHVRTAIAAAGLALVSLAEASTRNDGGIAVPGLIAVAQRPAEP